MDHKEAEEQLVRGGLFICESFTTSTPCMAATTAAAAAAAGAFYNIDAAKQNRVAKALSWRRGQDVRLRN